jgi:hypothetical protein
MISISLMGGLGNQLFQLAYGLSLSPNNSITLVPVLGNVRLNPEGSPEICSLELPERALVATQQAWDHGILTKLLGRGLRIAVSRSNRAIVKLIQRIIFILSNKEGLRVEFAHGVGSDVNTVDYNKLLYVGYFQSHRFVESPEVFTDMMRIVPKRESGELRAAIKEVTSSRPILIHVRLTDYLSPDSFGTPSVDYYRDALSQLGAANCKQEVWVFSDDYSRVYDFLPKEFSRSYRIAPNFKETCQTFELMRHFSAYVIGNSSFSWWGAYLRKDRNAPVICPWPWFKQNLHEKVDFIPEEWITIDSNLN